MSEKFPLVTSATGGNGAFAEEELQSVLHP